MNNFSEKMNGAKEVIPDCIIHIDASTEKILADILYAYGIKPENSVRSFCNHRADHCRRGLTINDLKEVEIKSLGKNEFGFECTTKEGNRHWARINLPIYEPRNKRLGY